MLGKMFARERMIDSFQFSFELVELEMAQSRKRTRFV